jgi:hypothetical protein
MEHRRRLEGVITTCRHTGSIVVAAHDDNGTRWLPGSLDEVVGVKADWTCDRHGYRVSPVNGRWLLTTSPYPRDIPGVPRERNLSGISFAVANATGFVARALEAGRTRGSAPTLSPGSDLARVFVTLHEAACVTPSA